MKIEMNSFLHAKLLVIKLKELITMEITPDLKKFIQDKEIVKIIIVPGRLVNIVVK